MLHRWRRSDKDLRKMWCTLTLSLSYPSKNRMRPNTQLNLKDTKYECVHLAVWHFVHWLPRYASNSIYCCISHRSSPGSIPGLVKWDLWWTKWSRRRFSPSTTVSPAIHSTKFSILTITRGRYNRPVSGWYAEWTQFGLHYPLCKLKKNYCCIALLTTAVQMVAPFPEIKDTTSQILCMSIFPMFIINSSFLLS
jgi:hypothetical protein